MVRDGCEAVALLLALLLAWSCLSRDTGRPLGSSCTGDDDCQSGLICRYGSCRDTCVLDRDCSPGQACVRSDRPGSPRVCTFGDEGSDGRGDESCPDGLVRGGDNICREPCATDEECDDGRRCDGRACVEDGAPPDGDADADEDLDAASDGSCAVDADADQWECLSCGYVHEAPAPPPECPICGAGCETFEPYEG